MKTLSFATVAMGALLSFGISVHAATIADPNIFSGASVSMSSEYNEGIFQEASATDGTSKQSFFGDNGASSLMSLSGFTATSGIQSLRFYDAEEYQEARVATQVTVYASSASLTGADLLDPAQYTLIGTFLLPINSGGFYSGGVDSNVLASDPGYAPNGSYNSQPYGSFDTLTGLTIAAGTTNVLFDFGADRQDGPGGQFVGQGFTEIQGFSTVSAPEPSTYAMMIAGCALLGFGVRRRLVRA